MASNTVRSGRIAFVKLLCIALVLGIKAEEESSYMESMEKGLRQQPNGRYFEWDPPAGTPMRVPTRPPTRVPARVPVRVPTALPEVLPEDNNTCDCVCGVSSTNRIAGGVAAGRREFPWFVGFLKRGTSFCGGSLITDRHVLTAAHCLEDEQV